MGLPPKPFISVIVATLNRTHYLEKCVKAILVNTYDEYEIIIIDQGRDDQTKELIDRQFSCMDRIRYMHTDTIGLSHARNLGWEKGRGEIIAFVDDDAIPVNGWLEAYAKAFSEIEPAPAMVGGRIEPDWEVPKPKWYPDEIKYLLGIYDIGDEIKPFSEPDLPVGANFAILRSILEKFGGFDSRVGFNKSRKKSMVAGEDSLIGLRVREAGYPIYYHPDAKVLHCIGETKLTRKYLVRRNYWEGVTYVVLKDCLDTVDDRWLLGLFFWHFKNIFNQCQFVAKYILLANKRPAKVMLNVSQLAYSVGICWKSTLLLLSNKVKSIIKGNQ